MASVQVASANVGTLTIPAPHRYAEHEAIHRMMDEMVDECVELEVRELSYHFSDVWSKRISGHIYVESILYGATMGRSCLLEVGTLRAQVIITNVSVELLNGRQLVKLDFVSDGEFTV